MEQKCVVSQMTEDILIEAFDVLHSNSISTNLINRTGPLSALLQ